MTGTLVMARLSWKRLVRGRALWLSVILFVVPLGVAVLTLRLPSAEERWSSVAEIIFRSLVLLAPVNHLASALGEELDGQTYTYFWSRPIGREVILAGKLLAVTPIIVLLAVLALVLAFAITSAGGGASDPAWLLRAIPAAALGVVTASAFAVGLGALVPRHPLVASLAWVLLAEQILPAVPAVQNLSAVHHVEVVAALPQPQQATMGGTQVGSVVALLVLAALWLAIAIWRVKRIEPGSVSAS
jgi:hypothetical protein